MRYVRRLLAVLLAVVVSPVAVAEPAAAMDNGLARTPPMGFNNWNATGCLYDFDHKFVRSMADLIVSRGLKDLGYEYVNIDDCWAARERDSDGRLQPDRDRFPDGIKPIVDYVHSKGLKFGIYSSAGTWTCQTAETGPWQGQPGSLGHERVDAELFASWGVDYLKYDNCGAPPNVSARVRYEAMRDALRATGRNILLALCNWGEERVWEWGAGYGNMWRTTHDIYDKWDSLLGIIKHNRYLGGHARPGAWNDPDMLQVGNGGMTDTEYRTHFTTWAMMAAPLMIGTDLRDASEETWAILKNRDLIDVNQDPLGVQASVHHPGSYQTVFVKPLAGGDVAVALFNEADAPAVISTSVERSGYGGASAYWLKDLWSKEIRSTTGEISATVPAHGTVVYRVTRAARIGVLAGGDLVVKQGSLSGGWPDAPRSGDVSDFRMDGDRIAVLNCQGELWIRNGDPDGPWNDRPVARNVASVQLHRGRVGYLTRDGVLYAGDVTPVVQKRDVVAFDMSGDRIGALTRDGVLHVKEGGVTGAWPDPQESAVAAFDLEGDRIGVLRANRMLRVKQGALNAVWGDPQTADPVAEFQLSGTRIGVRTTGGVLRVKDGALNAVWGGDQAGDVRSFELSGNRIGVLQNSGRLWVKAGGTAASWGDPQKEGVRSFDLQGDRIGALTTDGTLHVKEGPTNAGWAQPMPAGSPVTGFQLHSW
ncbi:glycoside hydrolase family 27 protein [Actinoplanes sp. NPDC051861]|uniref:glycoside hydrolase family 27 protein n=1 Tax=Actinoplanes sp. NPDC051861 TaxID=3155170 RepID=UPI00342661E6